MYHIYKITNSLNDKVYIGATKDINKRFKEHCKGHNTCNMGKAIKDLGAEHFMIESIATTKFLFEAFYVLEPYYIGFYKSDVYGYNGKITVARPLFYGTLKGEFDKLIKKQRRYPKGIKK